MNSLKNKTLFAIQIANVADVTTNSSSELFVLEGQTKEIVKEMISDVYPEYLSEYEELVDVREMSNEDIDSFLNWHLGRSSVWWSSGSDYSNPSLYKVLPTMTFEETYQTDVTLDPGREYNLRNNKPKEEMKNDWDTSFVTEENRQRVIEGIEQQVGRFFLYSIYGNPDWDFQEQLERIATRYHLG